MCSKVNVWSSFNWFKSENTNSITNLNFKTMKNQIIKTLNSTVKYWYLSLIVGLLFIFAGIWVLRTPLESYLTLSVLFSVTFFVNGILKSSILYPIGRIWTTGVGCLPEVSLTCFWILADVKSAGFYSNTTLFCWFYVDIPFICSHRFCSWLKIIWCGWLGMVISLRYFRNAFSFILLWNPMLAGMSIVIWTGFSLLSIGIFKIYLSLKLRQLHTFSKKLA